MDHFKKNGGNQLNKSKGSEQEVMSFKNKWKVIGQPKTRTLTERTESNEQKTKTKYIIYQILDIHFAISLGTSQSDKNPHDSSYFHAVYISSYFLFRLHLGGFGKRTAIFNLLWNVCNKLCINQR